MMFSTCLMSYNVYFNSLAMKLRVQSIGKLIEKYRPAVVAFQEVTMDTMDLFSKQKWFKYYDCSLSFVEPASKAYFVVLFSALPVLSFQKHVFPHSQMGRELIYAKIDLGENRRLVVGTSHLESLAANSKERNAQLKSSLDHLSMELQDDVDVIGAIFMGDTNLLHGELLQFDENMKRISHLHFQKAKSNRSQCRQCHSKIPKDQVRMGVKKQVRSNNQRSFEEQHWYHVSCFFNNNRLHQIQTMEHLQCIPGYTCLDKEAQKQINQLALLSKAISPMMMIQQQNQNNHNKMSCYGLPVGWQDVWLSVEGNTEDNGYTFDGKLNKMIRVSSYQSRFDRIFIKKGATFQSSKIVEIQRIGMQSIDENQKIWPSDHFGLQSVIQWIQDKELKQPFHKENSIQAKKKRKIEETKPFKKNNSSIDLSKDD